MLSIVKCFIVLHALMLTSLISNVKERLYAHNFENPIHQFVTAYRYTKILDELQEDTEWHGGPPDCIVSKSDECFCHFLLFVQL